MMTQRPFDPDDEQYVDFECGNCGGEGYVYNCQDEIGCIDPESGCDLCMRRCDWCNPPKARASLNDLSKTEGAGE